MNGNLLSTVWPKSQLLHKAVAVGLGVALLTLASKVQVPFWPVPMTLQTLAVLMIGATAGARLGGATVLAWLGLGALGFRSSPRVRALPTWRVRRAATSRASCCGGDRRLSCRPGLSAARVVSALAMLSSARSRSSRSAPAGLPC